jgi:hypothetical protein
MSDEQIDHIASPALDTLRAALRKAFEAGRAAEREAMKTQLLAVLTEAPDSVAARGHIAEQTVNDVRAQPGTVKPAIKDIIVNAADGIRASQIIAQTGFKDNSVRGTLASLKAEGVAVRRGDLWFPAPMTNLRQGTGYGPRWTTKGPGPHEEGSGP